MSVLNDLEEIYTDEDGPAIVFQCRTGKGRTTTAMAIGGLIVCHKKVLLIIMKRMNMAGYPPLAWTWLGTPPAWTWLGYPPRLDLAGVPPPRVWIDRWMDGWTDTYENITFPSYYVRGR